MRRVSTKSADEKTTHKNIIYIYIYTDNVKYQSFIQRINCAVTFQISRFDLPRYSYSSSLIF